MEAATAISCAASLLKVSKLADTHSFTTPTNKALLLRSSSFPEAASASVKCSFTCFPNTIDSAASRLFALASDCGGLNEDEDGDDDVEEEKLQECNSNGTGLASSPQVLQIFPSRRNGILITTNLGYLEFTGMCSPVMSDLL